MFSCAWAAGISNCTRIAPRGMQATVQAIYQVILGLRSVLQSHDLLEMVDRPKCVLAAVVDLHVNPLCLRRVFLC